ncbi:hypothetical protein P7G51_05595 [Enterococcus asini]|uniref:hypothetical protein n=1 Tax=Enterococcus asini TaxID=57732 RepID=UPI0028904719|nr:hypothetical protein [Enterococcus asini]MDT2756847.1 hypothetical protein [Enterococcus asini]
MILFVIGCFIVAALLPGILASNGRISEAVALLILGGVFITGGLLILLGKQYYLAAGVSLRSKHYSNEDIRKGRFSGTVIIGLGILLEIIGLVSL